MAEGKNGLYKKEKELYEKVSALLMMVVRGV